MSHHDKEKVMVNKSKRTIRPRNIVARTAMFRRAGVHEKTQTSKRQQQKRALNSAVFDYLNNNTSTKHRRGYFIFNKEYFNCHFFNSFCRIVI